MRSAWRLVACASDVPAVWLRRLLRQVKEQARPRAFPPNWPSINPAPQGAGYGLGVVLRRRGASRPDMTEVLLPGLTSDRHELVYWRGGRVDPSHAGYRSSSPPGRILIVFGAPIAFAITEFLHLVADGTLDAAIYGRVRAQSSARPRPTSRLRPRLISSGRDRYCAEAFRAIPNGPFYFY